MDLEQQWADVARDVPLEKKVGVNVPKIRGFLTR